ncbi:Protein hit [bioreactor metagenome]|uniref:Protein hit n=1 Tax=bioreactor metagenome TaxID=1076179 RepID=A0A645BJD3_9ZZZZ
MKGMINLDNCIFCKIISGDIPSATIYEDDEFKVILDRFPSNVGHALILTKKHYANIFEIDEDVAGRLFKLAVKVSKNMKDVLNLEAMNIVQNNGEMAGQTVHHFHLHLIPRYVGDKVSVKWEQLDLTDEQISEVQSKLKMN